MAGMDVSNEVSATGNTDITVEENVRTPRKIKSEMVSSQFVLIV